MATPATTSPSTSRERLTRALPAASLALCLLVGAVVLFRANRRQWFFGDEWDFLARRSVTDLDDLFAPHNEHWSTTPILVYRVLVRVFGLESYVPYIAVLILFHLALAGALWLLLRQVRVDPWISTLLTGVFIILGSGFENLLWAFQIGFVGSVLAGVGLLLLTNHDDPVPWNSRDLAASGLAVFALTFSGVTVTMVAVAAVGIWLRRSLLAAIRFAAGPTAVYLVWLAVIGKRGLGTHPRTLQSFLELPQYVWRGIGTGIESTVGIAGVGMVAFAVLAIWLLRRDGFAGQPESAATASFIGVMILFVVVGIGRTALGTEQAQSSRYAYLEMALLLPVVGIALTELARGRRARIAVIAVPLAFVALTNLGTLRSATLTEAERERAIKGQILAAAELVRTGQPILGAAVEPTYSPDLQVPALRTLARALPDDEPTRLDRLNAAVQLQVAVGPPTGDALGAGFVEAIDLTLEPQPDGCEVVRVTGSSPQLVLEVGDRPARLGIRNPAPLTLGVALRSGAPLVVGASRSFSLPAGESQLEIVAEDTSPVLAVPGSGTVVCGLVGGGSS